MVQSDLKSTDEFTGAISTFEKIGFREVVRRSPGRAILRYDMRANTEQE